MGSEQVLLLVSEDKEVVTSLSMSSRIGVSEVVKTSELVELQS